MKTIDHERYVSLEVAKLLKEAGFDWECNHYYFTQNGKTEVKSDFRHPAQNYNESMATMDSKSFEFEVCSCLTLDVVQRWLREVKNIAVYVCPSYEPERFVVPNVVADDEKWVMKWQVAAMHYDIESDEIDLGDVGEEIFDTYEEALDAGIKKALEIILEKGE